MKEFRKAFDYNAKKIFKIKDLNNLGDVKITTSTKYFPKSEKMVFFNKLIIEVPNTTCVDYINPEEWYLECYNQLDEYISQNIDISKYNYKQNCEIKYHTQQVVKKDLYLVFMDLNFTIEPKETR